MEAGQGLAPSREGKRASGVILISHRDGCRGGKTCMISTCILRSWCLVVSVGQKAQEVSYETLCCGGRVFGAFCSTQEQPKVRFPTSLTAVFCHCFAGCHERQSGLPPQEPDILPPLEPDRSCAGHSKASGAASACCHVPPPAEPTAGRVVLTQGSTVVPQMAIAATTALAGAEGALAGSGEDKTGSGGT